MSLRKRGKYWHSELVIDGVRHCNSTKLESHRDAIRWERQFRANLALGRIGLSELPTLESAFANWLDSKRGILAESHLDRAITAWKFFGPRIGRLRPSDLSESVLAGLVREWSDTRSARGWNTQAEYLEIVLGWVRKDFPRADIPKVPKLRIDRPARRVLSLAEVGPWLAKIDSRGNLHHSVAVRLALYLGLRSSEVAAARFDWLSPDRREFRVGKSKTKDGTVLPVPGPLRPFLWALTFGVCEGSGTLFRDASGQPPTRRWLIGICRHGGIAGVTPHCLRASTATILLRAGVSLPVVSRQLRHSRYATTEHYLKAIGHSDLVEAGLVWIPQDSGSESE